MLAGCWLRASSLSVRGTLWTGPQPPFHALAAQTSRSSHAAKCVPDNLAIKAHATNFDPDDPPRPWLVDSPSFAGVPL